MGMRAGEHGQAFVSNVEALLSWLHEDDKKVTALRQLAVHSRELGELAVTTILDHGIRQLK